jgi:hypothetical protein
VGAVLDGDGLLRAAGLGGLEAGAELLERQPALDLLVGGDPLLGAAAQ